MVLFVIYIAWIIWSFYIVLFALFGSWQPISSWLLLYRKSSMDILQYMFFCIPQKKVIQVQNDIRMRRQWQNLYFWWNIPLKWSGVTHCNATHAGWTLYCVSNREYIFLQLLSRGKKLTYILVGFEYHEAGQCVCVCVNDRPSHWLLLLILSRSMTTSRRVMEREKQRWCSEWVYLLKTGRMNVFVFACERQKVCVWVWGPTTCASLCCCYPSIPSRPIRDSESRTSNDVAYERASVCVCVSLPLGCVCCSVCVRVWERNCLYALSAHQIFFEWRVPVENVFALLYLRRLNGVLYCAAYTVETLSPNLFFSF